MSTEVGKYIEFNKYMYLYKQSASCIKGIDFINIYAQTN